MNTSSVPGLDLFTVKVMTLITVIVVSSATLLAWKMNRRVDGMRLFAFGLLSIAFGAILGLARIVIHGNAIIIACNVFMLGGMIALVRSIRVFRALPPLPFGAVAGLVAMVAVFYLYWMFARDSFGMRVAVISSAFAILSVDAAVSMFRSVPVRDRLVFWPTGFAFAFAALYLTARAAAAFSGSYGGGLLSPVPMEVASTICANAAYIGCAFGMLLASNTQLRLDAEKLSQFDALTNLPNRRLFLDRLLEAEQRAVATGRKFGVVYLDLNGFKAVNDTLGHDAGDRLLRKVSASMTRVLRPGDCLARIGGDEFVVLVEDSPGRGEVGALGERLKMAVESEPVPGYDVPLRISCGVAVFPEDGNSAHDVMREADAAMYQAKRQSRMSELPA
jgi:diguanylate cyclase (GGDEF)-like protein